MSESFLTLNFKYTEATFIKWMRFLVMNDIITLRQQFKIRLLKTAHLFILESLKITSHFPFFLLSQKGIKRRKQNSFVLFFNVISHLETEKLEGLITFALFCIFFSLVVRVVYLLKYKNKISS